MKGNKKRKFRFPTAFTVLFIALILAAFPIMIWGVSSGDWWFPEMSALFLAVALIIIFLSGLSEKEAVSTFYVIIL